MFVNLSTNMVQYITGALASNGFNWNSLAQSVSL